MKIEIKIPAMGESISEATIGTIMKSSGSKVATDEEILELETDKVNQVLYAPQAGILELKVKPEQVVKIGEVIGYVDTDKAESAPAKVSVPPKQSPDATIPPPTSKPVQTPPPARQQVESASNIRLGKEAFIEDVKGGKSEEQSFVSKAEQPKKTPSAPTERETRRKMTKIRKVIAKRMVEAQQTTAMLTTFNEVDLTEVMTLREKYKEVFLKKYQSKLGFMSFFVKATVSALEAFPDVNSYIDGDEIVHREYYDIGIAVGTDKGVMVPVVRDCDKLTFGEIEGAIENFAKRARDGTMTVDDLQGGGFSITNGGIYGSLLSTPILNPRQSAILGMHKISKRAVVVNDQIVIRPMMYLALSYDHRIIDGKEAVSFLVHIKNCLEDPARMLLEI